MQKERKCIFILGANKFDEKFESASYTLAKEFAKNNHAVYYIDYPFTWIDKIRLKNTHQFKVRQKAFAGDNEGIVDPNIPNLKIVIIPPLLSIHFLPESRLYRQMLSYNEKIILKRLTQLITKHSLKDIIYINSFVFHYPNLANYLKPLLSIYHCVDPVITPYDVKHGIISEKLLIQNSELIICTSKQLYNEKKATHQNTYFVPNAADITHSIRATDKNLSVHTSLENIKKPIIGYFGNIERRIDYKLLIEVAKKNQDKSFVFAGPIEKHLVPKYFFNEPNIYFTGRIPYQQMPNMLKGFDVAIIPFAKNNDSGTVFPLKLFEYLGAGKPVIATDFNMDLKHFTNDLVTYCGNAEEFSSAINNALKTNTEALQKERIALAGRHTWEKRAAEIEELIDKNIPHEVKE